MISKTKVIIFLWVFVLACSHTQIGDLITKNDLEIALNDFEDIDLSDKKKFNVLLKSIKREFRLAKKKSDISYSTWNKIGRLLEIYRSIRQLTSQNKILVPPKTQLIIKTDSFCIDPGLAAPDFREVFRWGYGESKIPFYPIILKYYVREGQKDKELIQELIWNLANKTYYEDYPEKLKKILREIDPNAYLKLPSRTKSEIIDAGVSAFEEASGTDIRRTIQIVKGKYYSFEEFRTALEGLNSAYPLPQTQLYSRIPNTSLFSTTRSQSYRQQIFHFYNPRNETQSLDLGRYYLKPLRADVQRIAITASFGDAEYFKDRLEQLFRFILGQLGSLYPNLENDEKRLIKKNPYKALRVFWRMATVEHVAGKIFDDSGQIDGEADAFRHFVWAGFLVHDLGESLASQFLAAHESGQPSDSRKRQMDEHNNKEGIEAALQLEKDDKFNSKNLYHRAIEALKNKELIILQPTGDIPDDASY